MTEPTGQADPVVVEVAIAAPREVVWEALTAPGSIADWWGEHVSFDARPGGRLVERWTDPGGRDVVTSGQVVLAVAPRELELTWSDGDWPAQTLVRVVLEKTAGGTRLRLTHSGWEHLPASRRQALIGDHASGWSRHMASLAGCAERMAP